MDKDVKNVLLWEKYRPQNLDEIILLPRIKNLFTDGIQQNYIFYGTYGIGKTSIARILIGKYTKDKDFLEINSSMETSIDILRSKIDNFWSFKCILNTTDSYKYVFLDEFERTSIQFQDAFKAFIERYDKHVRFIITTNNISKISDGIKSRIIQLNFNCIDINEEKYLKNEFYKRLKNNILVNEKITIDDKTIIKIINKNFPDFRSTMVELQNFILSGELTEKSSNVNITLKTNLYKCLYNKELNYEQIYNFLISNFGADKINTLIEMLGKPFIDFSIKKGADIEKLFLCNYIIADYSDKLKTDTDPIILGMTIIGKLRDVLLFT